MKLLYSEGTVFLVPLRNGGYARGVVARMAKRGKVLLGYFFGPRLASLADATLHDLAPGNALLRIMFGDLGLINREWPVIGVVPGWDRTCWPMPDFVRRDPLGIIRPFLVRYCDTDPTRVAAEYPIDDDSGLPTDSISGYGAVEIKLTKLLG